jgi:GNAT superfamily N-acetyltransferase
VSNFLRVRERFVISTDPELLDTRAVFQFLTEANWWSNLTEASLERALQNSLCFSLLEDGRQIGVARVITDRATYAYLCDVFIISERRGQGLGGWLVRSILEHPELKDLRRIALITHNAQSFYRTLDFELGSHPTSYMERLR